MAVLHEGYDQTPIRVRERPDFRPVDDGLHLLQERLARLARLAIGIAHPSAITPVGHVIDAVTVCPPAPPPRPRHHRAAEIADTKLPVAILDEHHVALSQLWRKKLRVGDRADKPGTLFEDVTQRVGGIQLVDRGASS